jgi:hypothetical protein
MSLKPAAGTLPPAGRLLARFSTEVRGAMTNGERADAIFTSASTSRPIKLPALKPGARASLRWRVKRGPG